MSNPVLDQERVDFLRARVTDKKALLPAWPRSQKELPVIEVEVDWVRFSTLNHRTKAEQLRSIHDANQPDLFTADPLGKEAQEAQFKILREQKGFEELKNDLHERHQQEYAVISAEGVLVNGNRRTAALRSLYLDDHLQDARYLRCLLLPEDATANELVDLEAELQIAKDFKEEYSWVNEAMLIEELFDREGRNFAHVAHKMHQDEQNVRSLYEKLQQLHQLVALSKGARLHIDFTENESAFDELSKHIKNKPKSEQESVRSAYFLGTLSGVNYRMLRHLRRPDAADLVHKAMTEDKALKPFLDTIEAASAADADSTADALEDLLGGLDEAGQTAKSAELMGILGFLATKNREESVPLAGGESVLVQDLHDTIQKSVESAAAEAEEDAKDSTAVTAPMARIEDAIGKVLRAKQTLGKARTFAEWKETDFQEKVAKLRGLIEKLAPPDT